MFTYGEAKKEQADRHDALRKNGLQLALLINDLCPDSIEKALAISKLQQAIMYANASISIHDENSNLTPCEICK